MAPTPRRSLKQTLAGTVEGRSPRFLLSSLVLAMVISLVAGLGIGIKIEQHRVKTKKAKPVAVAKKKPKTVKAKGGSKGPLNGIVVLSRPKLLVISARGRRVSIAVVPRTRVEVTDPATPSDIVAGSRVLFAQSDDRHGQDRHDHDRRDHDDGHGHQDHRCQENADGQGDRHPDREDG